MKKCKWCKEEFDPKKQSEAFCSDNPNLERNKNQYFDGSKKYKIVRKARNKSLNSLIAKVRIAKLILY